MTNSWGHVAYRLAEDEIAIIRCRAPKCEEPVTHVTQYSYVTGRAGRTSFSSRYVCTGHAEKFAAKYKIEVADARPSREDAMRQRAAALRERETTP